MNQPSPCISAPSCPWHDRVVLSAVDAEPEESAAVQDHLRGCESCRRDRAGAQAAVTALRSLPPAEGRDLTAAVLERLPRKGAPDWLRLAGSPWARAAAVLLAAGALGLALTRIAESVCRPLGPEGCPSPAAVPLAASVATPGTARREAIDWLVSTQRKDGTWDIQALGGRPEHAPALTALALMALQAEVSPAAVSATRGAATALLGLQRETGCFGDEGPFMLYNHGIATVALLMFRDSSADPRPCQALDAAIAFIRNAQQPGGGWGYRPGVSGGPANVSVSAWQLDALGRARRQGWDDARGHLRRGLFWLSTLADHEGRVGYRQPGDLPSARITNTAIGLYCLIRTAEGIDGTQPAVRKMARSLKRLTDASQGTLAPNPYRDYFTAMATLAWKTSASGIPAPPELAPMLETLAASRIRSGPERGSWDPRDAYARVGGRLYATSLSAMALRPTP